MRIFRTSAWMNDQRVIKAVSIASVLIFIMLIIALTAGCTAGKVTEPYKDAPRGSTNDDKADTITFPDGFNNVSTKCDHGNRVYVTYHNDAPYGALAVVPNAKGC